MTVERMASVDAAWLHMDRPTNLMVVNAALLFDQALDWGAVTAAIEQRFVATFPRFRQRVADPPLTLGRLGGPSWLDDPTFRLRDHLRRHRLHGATREEALRRYVSRHMSVPLDRTRPLWEAHLLDGYGEGSALLLRMHHAIADGIAFVQLLLTLTDSEAGADDGARLAIADPPDDRGGFLRAAKEAAATASRVTSRLMDGYVEAVTHPRTAVEVAAAVGAHAAALRTLSLPLASDRSVLHGPLGVAKWADWSRPAPLRTIRRVGRATGCTVNDIMLATIAGALRRYLAGRGPVPELVRALVPVNLRPPGAPLPRGLGNRFGLVFVDLPVGAEARRDRLARVSRQMSQIKASQEGLLVYGGLGMMGQSPVQVQRAWGDLFSARADAVITNVVGPRRRAVLAGRPLRGLIAWVPTSGPIGLGLSIVSYDGSVTVGVTADARLIPDRRALLDALETEIDGLPRLGG